MAGIEGIVLALGPFGETGKPVLLPQSVKITGSSGEKFMGVALMPHVPHNLVQGSLENPVQGYSQFNDPKIRRKVTAVPADHVYDAGTDFLGQGGELTEGQVSKIGRGMDPIQ